MRQLADDVWQLSGFPRDNVNVYVIGDVLIDAGAPWDRHRIARQIEGRSLSAHALTHAHPDHVGASHAICNQFALPLWCGAEDAEAVERGKTATRFGNGWFPGPAAHPVAKELREGDTVAGFAVLETPGTPPATSATGGNRTGISSAETSSSATTRSCCWPAFVSLHSSSASTPPSTAAPPSASPSSSRRSPASGTARRCATRRFSAFADKLPEVRPRMEPDAVEIRAPGCLIESSGRPPTSTPSR